MDRSLEHLGTSDTAIIEMRRLLMDGARIEGRSSAGRHADSALYRLRAYSAVIAEDADFD